MTQSSNLTSGTMRPRLLLLVQNNVFNGYDILFSSCHMWVHHCQSCD